MGVGIRVFYVAVLAMALGAAIGASLAGALTPVPPRPALATPNGIGELRLGDTIGELRDDDLIGPVRQGCQAPPKPSRYPMPVVIPEEFRADLRPPLEGIAVFQDGRLVRIGATGGVRTRTGVTIGSTAGEAREAYPNSNYDPPGSEPVKGSDEVLPIGLLSVRGGKARDLMLVFSSGKRRVSEIGVPLPSLCEGTPGARLR